MIIENTDKLTRKINASLLRKESSVKFQSKHSDRALLAEKLRNESVCADFGVTSVIPAIPATSKETKRVITHTNSAGLSTYDNKFFNTHFQNIGKSGHDCYGFELNSIEHVQAHELANGLLTMKEIKAKYGITQYVITTYFRSLGLDVSKNPDKTYCVTGSITATWNNPILT